MCKNRPVRKYKTQKSAGSRLNIKSVFPGIGIRIKWDGLQTVLSLQWESYTGKTVPLYDAPYKMPPDSVARFQV